SSICTSGSSGNIGGTACNGNGPKKDASQIHVQGGITKNWTGLGNTSLFGEWGRSDDWGALGTGTGGHFGRDFPTTSNSPFPFAAGTGNSNFNGVANVTDTRIDMLGLGLVQNLDAAATELYISWRHFDPKLNGTEYACSTGSAGSNTTPSSNCASTSLGA